jgi:hypothetical protein
MDHAPDTTPAPDLFADLFAAPTPGWSNAPPDSGISSLEPAPIPKDTTQPGWSNNGPDATGATAGAPGTWIPANADVPDSLTATKAGVTAIPATAWTTGQYMLLGDGTYAHWDGTTWAAGKA